MTGEMRATRSRRPARRVNAGGPCGFGLARDQPAEAEPLAEALAFTDTSIETDAFACASIDDAKHAPTLSAASPPEVTAACAPSSEVFTLATTFSSLPFMPIVTFRIAGRSLARAALSLAAAWASAAPSIFTITEAGWHSSL